MRHLWTAVLAVSLTPATLELAAAEPPLQAPQPSPTVLTPLMQMKLTRSKAILEGLALEDLEAVGKNARALGLLSLESGWNVIQTEEYERQSSDFRRAAGAIANAAGEKDVGRATLGYVELTVRCIECHRYMRSQRAALADQGPD
ncbi:MAG: hypothetical protein ACO1RT_11580 [Planctomycetaceae bacterium]